jgi:hypothetical protein
MEGHLGCAGRARARHMAGGHAQRWREVYEGDKVHFDIKISGMTAWDAARAATGDQVCLKVQNEGTPPRCSEDCIRVTIPPLSGRRPSQAGRQTRQYVLFADGRIGCLVQGRGEELPEAERRLVRWDFV